MLHLNRTARFVVFVALMLLPAIASAQAAVHVHSFYGAKEVYTIRTTVGYYDDNEPGEHFFTEDGYLLLNLPTNKNYRIAQVIAGFDGRSCFMVSLSDQGGFVSPATDDTSNVNVSVAPKYCQYYVDADRALDDTAARGEVHFHADQSWKDGHTSAGQPILLAGGPIDITCHLDDDPDCEKGTEGDQGLAYGSPVYVTFTPGSSGNRVSGKNPFTNEFFLGAPGAVVTLTGTADSLLDFTDIKFSTVHGGVDGSIAFTSSALHDTVVTGTFHLHNAGPDAGVFAVSTQGNTVVRAGSGSVAKIEITTPTGSCVQTTSACATVSLTAGASADITVKTTTARLGDTSGAAVGANSCGTITIFSPLDAVHVSDNSVACVSGTSTPVTVAVTTGENPPASQTVATGATNVPVLQFAMAPSAPVTLDNITIAASGSGNDQVDITAVKLFVDANGNGIVDGSEASIASGTFGANNGTVTLAVAPTYTVSAPTSFLVTFDFNTTLASRYGGALVLAGLLPVALVPRRRRRSIAGALMFIAGLGVASLGLGACGGDSTGPNPPSGNATFTATLNGMTAGGSAVSGVSVHGATITIAK